MNLALWIVQALVALVVTGTGALKAFTPKEKLEVKMRWARTWDPARIKLLGLAEMLGAVGLVVPGWTGIVPILTSVAAACLAVLMAGAVKAHVDLKEPSYVPAVVGVLCLLIAIGRSGIVP